MKLLNNSIDVQSFGDIGGKAAQIKSSGKMLSLLVDRLYAYKYAAVVRELCANAADSHVMAGHGDRPFDVYLPSDISPFFIVEDHGTGLNRADVEKYFGTLGESSKEENQDQIGALGLGCKSPFAVTDSFTIESRCEGLVHTFTYYKNSELIPCLMWNNTRDMKDDEENGITVKVPSDPSTHNEYVDGLRTELFTFKTLPRVDGSDKFEWAKVKRELFVGEGFRIVQLDEHDRAARHFTSRKGDVVAVMGGVTYPIRLPPAEYDKCPHLKSFRRMGATLIIDFEMGTIDFQPSREELSYDPQTVENIITRVNACADEFISDYESFHYKTLRELEANGVDCFTAYERHMEMVGDFKFFGHLRLVYRDPDLGYFSFDENSPRPFIADRFPLAKSKKVTLTERYYFHPHNPFDVLQTATYIHDKIVKVAGNIYADWTLEDPTGLLRPVIDRGIKWMNENRHSVREEASKILEVLKRQGKGWQDSAERTEATLMITCVPMQRRGTEVTGAIVTHPIIRSNSSRDDVVAEMRNERFDLKRLDPWLLAVQGGGRENNLHTHMGLLRSDEATPLIFFIEDEVIGPLNRSRKISKWLIENGVMVTNELIHDWGSWPYYARTRNERDFSRPMPLLVKELRDPESIIAELRAAYHPFKLRIVRMSEIELEKQKRELDPLREKKISGAWVTRFDTAGFLPVTSMKGLMVGDHGRDDTKHVFYVTTHKNAIIDEGSGFKMTMNNNASRALRRLAESVLPPNSPFKIICLSKTAMKHLEHVPEAIDLFGAIRGVLSDDVMIRRMTDRHVEIEVMRFADRNMENEYFTGVRLATMNIKSEYRAWSKMGRCDDFPLIDRLVKTTLGRSDGADYAVDLNRRLFEWAQYEGIDHQHRLCLNVVMYMVSDLHDMDESTIMGYMKEVHDIIGEDRVEEIRGIVLQSMQEIIDVTGITVRGPTRKREMIRVAAIRFRHEARKFTEQMPELASRFGLAFDKYH